VVADESHPQMARVEVRLKGGRLLEGEQEDARGTEMSPFSDEVMEAKFRRLAVSLPGDQAEHVIHTVARMEEMTSMSQLVPLLQRRSNR